MDITLLVSELREVPSYSTPVKKVYEAEAAIVEVTDEASIEALMAIHGNCDLALTELITNSVDIRVMRTHAKIVKPFVSNDDLEDDFI
jgi:hypothetical protein